MRILSLALIAVIAASGHARAVTIPDLAVRACRHLAGEPGAAVARELLEIERREGLPEGLLVATAYEESHCGKATHCGDGGRSCGVVQFGGWAIPGIRDVALELDLALEGDPRHNTRAAATYWARRAVRAYAFARDGAPPGDRARPRLACRGRGGYASRIERLWASADLTSVRAPRCIRRICVEDDGELGDCLRYRCVERGPRCAVAGHYETNHWRRLRRWRRIAGDGAQTTRAPNTRGGSREAQPEPAQGAPPAADR